MRSTIYVQCKCIQDIAIQTLRWHADHIPISFQYVPVHTSVEYRRAIVDIGHERLLKKFQAGEKCTNETPYRCHQAPVPPVVVWQTTSRLFRLDSPPSCSIAIVLFVFETGPAACSLELYTALSQRRSGSMRRNTLSHPVNLTRGLRVAAQLIK